MKGCREDGIICPFPNTQTRKCGNPFCGFTFAVSFDEMRFAKETGCYQTCPKCGYGESTVVHMQFEIINLRCK